MQAGLNRLGELRTRSKSDFEHVLGAPSAVRTLFNGKRLVEWQRGRFNAQSIVVLFDPSERFLDVVSGCNVRLLASCAPRAAEPRDSFAEGRRIALALFAGV